MSNKSEVMDYNDYNEIVAVSRADNETRTTGHNANTAHSGTDSGSYGSGDSLIRGNVNYSIPAMYYYCEKPGSYIVTYLAKTCIGRPSQAPSDSTSGYISNPVDRIRFRSGNGSVTHNVSGNWGGDGGPMVTIETV